MAIGANFGIEEEYFITSLLTRELVAEPPKLALKKCKASLGACFVSEMFQSQVEVASPVFSGFSQAREYFTGVRSQLRELLAPYGLGVVSAGSHPLPDWRAQRPTAEQHFLCLRKAYQHVARRSHLSGLHVHVEIPRGVDRVRVMNEVLPVTPLLLAISSSSPFWDGVDTGFMSYRQAFSDQWPRTGVPVFLESQSDYNDYVKWLIHNTEEGRANCWWGIRPSQRFPTLELRMTDACPRLEDALNIAALFYLMVIYAARLPAPGANFCRSSRWVVEENRWRAQRHGIHASFIVEGAGQSITASEWVSRLEYQLSGITDELNLREVFDGVRRILARGTSADRQRAVFELAVHRGHGAEPALAHVVDELIRETSGG